MQLGGPVGLRIRLQPLVEPRALELQRLFGRERLAGTRLLEDAAAIGLGVGGGEDLGDAVVGHHAPGLGEEGMALRHGGEEVVPRLHGHLRGGGQLVHPRVPGLEVLDLAGLVAAPGRTNLRVERRLGDGEMVFEGIDGIVRRADDLDIGLLHESARGKALARKLGVALLPDALGGGAA